MTGADRRIVPLADVPEAIAALAALFEMVWAPYYGPGGPGDARTDLEACCNRNRIPLAVVARAPNGLPIGTAALKAESLASHRHLTPWLAALVVAPEHRRKGVATALVASIEREAWGLGFDAIHAAMDAARSGVLKHPGWQAVDTAPTLTGDVTIYRRALRNSVTNP